MHPVARCAANQAAPRQGPGRQSFAGTSSSARAAATSTSRTGPSSPVAIGSTITATATPSGNEPSDPPSVPNGTAIAPPRIRWA